MAATGVFHIWRLDSRCVLGWNGCVQFEWLMSPLMTFRLTNCQIHEALLNHQKMFRSLLNRTWRGINGEGVIGKSGIGRTSPGSVLSPRGLSTVGPPGGDERLKKVQLIRVEVDVLRQAGERAPDCDRLTEEQWDYLMTIPTSTARRRHYSFLWLKQMYKFNERVRHLLFHDASKFFIIIS